VIPVVVYSYFIPAGLPANVLGLAIVVLTEPVGLLALIVVGGGALAKRLP
jgi:hypothetical protein